MFRVLVLAFAAACGRVDFAPASDGGDGGSVDAAAPCTEPWGPPVELMLGVGGNIDPSLTADELELLVTTNGDLYVLTRVSRDAAWSAPMLLATPPNTVYPDTDPSVSGDGLTLYFMSTRMSTAQMQITTRPSRTGAWGLEVQTGYYGRPEVSEDNLELYFQDYMGPIERMTRSSPLDSFPAPAPLNTLINDGSLNVAPSVSGDGLDLYFCSGRAGSNFEIFVAHRSTRAEDFTTVETTGLFGASPEVSSDGHHLYLSDLTSLFVASRCE